MVSVELNCIYSMCPCELANVCYGIWTMAHGIFNVPCPIFQIPSYKFTSSQVRMDDERFGSWNLESGILPLPGNHEFPHPQHLPVFPHHGKVDSRGQGGNIHRPAPIPGPRRLAGKLSPTRGKGECHPPENIVDDQ